MEIFELVILFTHSTLSINWFNDEILSTEKFFASYFTFGIVKAPFCPHSIQL